MNAIIISDLHIGSRFFLYQEFERFIRDIPDNYELVLNGDIIDNPFRKLTLPHQHLLDQIKKASNRHKVVWVEGNHDKGFVPNGFGKVQFRRTHNIENRLLIAHGHDFDDIMPKNLAFMKVFKLMHDLRVMLGAQPVHVAKYAKKWELFYRVLRGNVMKNAVKCAIANGYEAVVCGHTHYPEDLVYDGIKYVNTGAWTESPVYYLLVTADEMSLKKVGDSFGIQTKEPVRIDESYAAQN